MQTENSDANKDATELVATLELIDEQSELPHPPGVAEVELERSEGIRAGRKLTGRVEHIEDDIGPDLPPAVIEEIMNKVDQNNKLIDTINITEFDVGYDDDMAMAKIANMDKKPAAVEEEKTEEGSNINAPAVVGLQPERIIRRPPPPSMLIDPRGEVASTESTNNTNLAALDINASTRSVPVLEATLVQDAVVKPAPKATVYEATLLIERSEHKDEESYASEDGQESYASEDGQDDNMEEIKLSRWFLLAAVMNFGLQVMNVVMATGRGRWSSLVTTKKVGGGMVFISSILGAVNSPVIVYKQRQINLRTAVNCSQKRQIRITKQNDVLSAEIDDLQSEVDRMKDLGIGDKEMEDLLDENKEINEDLMEILKSRIVEKIVPLVLEISIDSRFLIQAEDTDKLVTGMNKMEEIQSFDEVLFLQDICRCKGHVEVIAMVLSMIHCNHDEVLDGQCAIMIEDWQGQWLERERNRRKIMNRALMNISVP